LSLAETCDHFAARGGLALRRRRTRGSRITRVLVIVHGLAEHSARYAFVARWFAERGYAVYSFDQRGHGESEGPRTHAPSFEILLDDIERLLAEVSRECPGLPVVLLGHSMGGLEVAALLADRRPAVAAAVLSGPALALRGGGRGRILLARLLSAMLPRFPIPRPVDPTQLSRDPAVVEAYRNDPLVPKRMSARLAASLLDAARAVEGKPSRVEVPVLIVHGEQDLVCSVDGSRRFHGGLRPAGSDLVVYPGLRHEVLNEPEREQVLTDIGAWIEKHVPAGSPA
jgi:alpha-beta hydrolase superfamily lysophospholipase